MKKILILSLLNEKSPALRYRVIYPLQLLESEKKVVYDKLFFYSDRTTEIMNTNKTIKKIIYVLIDLLKYLYKFIRLSKNYDTIIIKSYIFPFGNEVIEKLIYNKYMDKEIIYDIDDAIYMNETREQNKSVKRFRNATKKVEFWYRYSDILMVSNNIILDDLKKLFSYEPNKIVKFLTCPRLNQYFRDDKELVNNKAQESLNFIWLGSPHTQNNLKLIDGFIKKLKLKLNNKNIKVFIIGTDQNFNLFKDIEYVKFIDWTPENENKYMKIAHIGLNPLYNNEFEIRKSAFKVIQYYRAGIVPIVSNVGINKELVGEFGGLCVNDFLDDEIFNYINNIIENDEATEIYSKTKRLTLESNKEKIFNVIRY